MKKKNHLDADPVLFGGIIMNIEKTATLVGNIQAHFGFLGIMIGVAKLAQCVALNLVDLG
jgi:hypothetical protein